MTTTPPRSPKLTRVHPDTWTARLDADTTVTVWRWSRGVYEVSYYHQGRCVDIEKMRDSLPMVAQRIGAWFEA